MPKILSIFLLFITFIMGLSVGVFYSFLNNTEQMPNENKLIDSVQDVVIKNVQSEKDDLDKQEVSSNIIRISPYAKMIIEKKYTKCGHTTVNIVDVPKELINLSLEELEKKYSGWTVTRFTTKDFTLYREIDANCDDHFVLKEDGGYVAVFSDITEDSNNIIRRTNIMVEDLREEDKHDLEQGIRIYGEETLNLKIKEFL